MARNMSLWSFSKPAVKGGIAGRVILLSFLFYFLLPGIAGAQEVPRVIHFTRQQYQGQNQNWSICQGADRRMYFGNSGGLLMYDGTHWYTFPLPGGRVARAVACMEDGKVFTGSYANAGFWAPDETGKVTFHSVLEGVEYERTEREEIWHFLSTSQGLFFQSFSTLYRYREGAVEVIPPPGNVMFIREVEGRILVPAIHEGLYEYLPDGQFSFLEGSEPLAGKRVAAILPSKSSEFLVATQDDGLYRYEAGRLTHWEASVNNRLASVQVNKGLRLSNGNMAIGTILDGVYIIDSEGELAFHINQENGLQNNTVLALYEDEDKNLWVALDKGIDLVVTNSSLAYFSDKRGVAGSVFAAALFNGRLYIGTNQGVFFKAWPSRQGDSFRLVPGSQGQVWELKVLDGKLLCAHNSGVFQVKENAMEPLYSSTGVYHILEVPFREECLLLATYTGLAVLARSQEGRWAFSHTVEGFSSPARDAFFDARNRLWIAHPHQGVFCLRFSEGLRIAEPVPLPAVPGYPPFQEISADISYWGQKVFIWPDSGQLAFNTEPEEVKAIPEQEAFPEYQGNEKWLPGRGGALFRAFPDHVEFVDGEQHSWLGVSLVPDNERIIGLSDTVYLLGTEEGYAIFHTGRAGHIRELNIPAPIISFVEIKSRGDGALAAGALESPLILSPSENRLRFSFGLPFYIQDIKLRCRLKGFEEEWTAFGREYSKEYINLPSGSYTFQVQSALSSQAASFAFVIEPHWYQAFWVKLTGLALLALLGMYLYRVHENRMERQRRRLEIQKERELQQQRVQSRNEMLQAELMNKSRKLADSTMELVRKNEMLVRLKKELSHLRKKKEVEHPGQNLQKMIRQIDSHLSSEEDWEVFESNFNQVHDQFFKRLKEAYPDLTPGDLRLAAYLKMNLTSKDISPLLNISLRGVENKRYRLRRKMNLGPEENLTEFLMQF
ncbi:MAG: hypothetical protein H6560_23985 [Lewinellaceae bacterium]|nr:hypothetical protein [Lewinellaceae bacterium]